MATPHPYILVKDNDCHNYVIPREKAMDWDAWREVPEPDLNLPEEETDYTAWNVPEYAKAVGGSPDLVTFNLDGTYSIG